MQVAGQRELEAPGQAERVGGEDRRERQVLDALDELEPAAPHLAAVSGVRPWNMLTSTPPVHARPSARMSSPRGGSAPHLSIAALSAVEDLLGRRGSAAACRSSGRRAARRARASRARGRSRRSASAAAAISSWSPGAGIHGSSQRVVLVARDDVDVEVEDRLPRRGAARVEQVDAVGAEALARLAARAAARPACTRRGPRRDRRAGPCACSRGIDERVAARRRVDVHEAIVRSSSSTIVAGQLARDDLAEDAVGIRGHGGERTDQPRLAPDGAPTAAHDRAHLTAWERPSASDGERRRGRVDRRRAARARLRGRRSRRSAPTATYWWPLGPPQRARGASPALVRAAPARRARRRRSRALGDLGRARPLARALAARAAAEALDVERRRARRATATPTRTVVVVAHHDAAHGGLIFHSSAPRAGTRARSRSRSSAAAWPPLMARRRRARARRRSARCSGRATAAAGDVMAPGGTAAFADIGRRDTVPGANDNLSAVAALLEIAPRARARAGRGLRVLLVSTGSEESFEEGMRRSCAARPRAGAGPDRLIVLDTLGSPRPDPARGRGHAHHAPYDKRLKDGDRRGRSGRRRADHPRALALVRLRRAGALRAATARRTVGSLDELKLPANYHQPADVADNVDCETVAAPRRRGVRAPRRSGARAGTLRAAPAARVLDRVLARRRPRPRTAPPRARRAAGPSPGRARCPSSRGELVAAHERLAAARARAVERRRRASRGRARGAWRSPLGLAPARGEPVGDGQQRDVDLDRLASP